MINKSNDDFIQSSFMLLVTIMGITLLTAVFMVVSNAFYELKHPCISSHKEKMHHNSYYSYIYTGKIYIPHFNREYDYFKEICDKRA